jgi:hypothetical protein
MTDTMTSQNIDLSSWDTLYIKHTEPNVWALNAVSNEYRISHLLHSSKFSNQRLVSKKWHGPAEMSSGEKPYF